MESSSLTNPETVGFPSFKKDLAKGLSNNAGAGTGVVFVMGLVLAVLTLVVASFALYQNTNFEPDDPLDPVVLWISVSVAAIAGITLLVSPWLIYQSLTVATINFIFMLLVLCVVVICLMAIAQSQWTDSTDEFETGVFWVSIIVMVLAIMGGVGLAVLVIDFRKKKNPEMMKNDYGTLPSENMVKDQWQVTPREEYVAPYLAAGQPWQEQVEIARGMNGQVVQERITVNEQIPQSPQSDASLQSIGSFNGGSPNTQELMNFNSSPTSELL